jgi:multiple sugar transport system permease protein
LTSVTPAIVLMALLQAAPIAMGANASFRNWTLHNPRTWVGSALQSPAATM